MINFIADRFFDGQRKLTPKKSSVEPNNDVLYVLESDWTKTGRNLEFVPEFKVTVRFAFQAFEKDNYGLIYERYNLQINTEMKIGQIDPESSKIVA